MDPARADGVTCLPLVEEMLDGLIELVELLCQDRLNDVEVDSKVLVRDEVPESDDPNPGNLRSTVERLLGELTRRLTDNNEVVSERRRWSCDRIRRQRCDLGSSRSPR